MAPKREQIEKALDAKGYTVTSIEWSPVAGMVEMQGREGGWFVFYEPPPPGVEYEGFVGGFSAAEVLEQVAELPSRPEGHDA